MRLHEGMSVNEKGHLLISGCDTVELAEHYGTPLYVIDEENVRTNCKRFASAVKKYFKSGRVMYASKAFMNKAICRIMVQEGLGIDTVSGGELFTALSAGVKPQYIELHGNNKSREELEMAISNGIYRIIVDGFDEIALIEEVAEKLNKRDVPVSIRLRPNIDVHAHKAVQTAKLDCKFGFGIIDGQALRAAEMIVKSKYMSLKGLHCHIGSQIFDPAPFSTLIEHFIEFAQLLREELGIIIEEFNCGGGFGVWYSDADSPRPVDDFLKEIADAFGRLCEKYDYPMPSVSIEPGRAIIGEAGTTLYTVGGIKEITGIRTYCSVDGGMYENIRTALYDARYTAVAASKMNAKADKIISITGKCCESGDMITWDSPMPAPECGDILAVLTTGAYNYSMASNYNRNAVPAVVFVHNGKSDLAVKRQSYEYITENDLIPEHLR